jgi:hypothetical protein
MKQCRQCGKTYSDTYRRCPYCGNFSRRDHFSIIKWLRNGFYLMLLIGFIGLLMWMLNHWT